jgi:DNA repair protein RadA/Sms
MPGLRRLEHPGRDRGRLRLGRQEPPEPAQGYAGLANAQPVTPLSAIEAQDVARTPSGIEELDRVLGGGVVEGGVVLIGGDPGMVSPHFFCRPWMHCIVSACPRVTGEESGAQVALRSRRLGLDNSQVNVLAEIQLEKILATVEATQPAVVVIDSIQTVYSDQLSSAPGSVAQVRECAAHLTRAAKTTGITIILVGHVTKDGALAGPRVLEHMVDTVLYFEGDTHSNFRLVRAIKNRFGAVNEIGVFAMTEKGLKGVTNPSAIFLSQHSEPVPGSCVLVTLEGTRPMLVEIQALVDQAVRLRAASRSAWTATGWPCCWRCSTAMRAWPAPTRMSSSTPWAACASMSLRPTWR